jgi:peptidyl-prolyl cis-trans isomerase B (cyclophilin B)
MPRLPLRLLIALIACSLAVAACGGSDSNDAAGEAVATPAPADAKTATGCEPADKPAPKATGKIAKPTTALDPAKTYVATVATSCGDFQITLAAKRAPKTGGSFKYLADQGFFDGTTFHRIVAGFVIQGGDPQGNGQGGPDYSIVEAPPKSLQYTKGVVAMAKTQLEEAGTSGSQFFVVTGEDTQLPPEYALLGKLTGGQDVVDRIAAVDTDPSTEEPIDPVVIRSIKVTEQG